MDDIEAQLLDFPGADLVSALEISRIFEDSVWPAYAHLAALGGMRKAVLLIGQMGAGKSHLAARLAGALADSAHHDHIDAYRPYHPRSPFHLQTNPALYTVCTQQFSHHARRMLLPRLCEAGVPIVMERVEKSYVELLAAAREITDRNYDLTLSVMSVPPRVSWQGCVARYLDAEARQTGSGRWTDRGGHNLRCNDLIDNAVRLVQSPLISGWTVETRTASITQSGKDRDNWPLQVAAAITEEWWRPGSDQERSAYNAEWRRINALARQIPLRPDLKDEIIRRYEEMRCLL